MPAVIEEVGELGLRKPREELAVDGDCRRQGAGSQAGHDLDAEQAIARGLAGLDAQGLGQALERLGGAFDVASGAAAKHDMELALGLEAELVVEGGHAVNLAGGYAHVPADADDSVFGEVSELGLDFLKNGNQVIPLRARMALKYRIHHFGSLQTHSVPPPFSRQMTVAE